MARRTIVRLANGFLPPAWGSPVQALARHHSFWSAGPAGGGQILTIKGSLFPGWWPPVRVASKAPLAALLWKFRGMIINRRAQRGQGGHWATNGRQPPKGGVQAAEASRGGTRPPPQRARKTLRVQSASSICANALFFAKQNYGQHDNILELIITNIGPSLRSGRGVTGEA